MINFYSLKWGTKYGPEYANRIYGSLLANIKVPFTYTLVTDDMTGIRPEINHIDLKGFDYFEHQPKQQIWTREKLSYFKHFQKGRNLWLDLDILIHKDITEEVTGPCEKPTLIWNYWQDQENAIKWYGKKVSCVLNSSFVMWHDDNGMEIFNHLKKNEEKAFFSYRSLDKFLYYQCHRHGMIDYWPEDFVSNYNKEGFKLKGKVSIFNTSHVTRNKNITDNVYELDEADEWTRNLWMSYS